ncbi:MAG TPA: hypothetical protein VLU91_04375 [Nitrososphaerales archaeon]|nr:hypothetical protein [Nitrososphaerales archaeon]
MKVTVFRDGRNRAKYHLHPEGSGCGWSPSSESRIGDAEMPEVGFKALEDRLSSRGYTVVPDDIANNELASDWWSVVSMIMR